MASFRLRFQAVACPRCGVSRQACVACSDCGKGPAPTEFDVEVQRRQRIVDRAAVPTGPTGPPEVDALELLRSRALAQLPDRTFAAGAAVATGSADAEQLLAEISQEVASVSRWADTVPMRRPLIGVTRHTQAVARSLVRLHDKIVHALRATTMADAQLANHELQPALDEAAHAAREGAEILDRLDTVLSSTDPVATWVAEAVKSDPRGAAAAGQQLFEHETGHGCGPGAGLLAIVLNMVCATIGDTARFWKLVGDHLAVLRANPAGVAGVFADPTFGARAHEVTEDLWAAARRAAVTTDPETLRQATTDILEAGHLVWERALKFHLGAACAATTKMTFTNAQGSDVSELVNLATAKGWAVGLALPAADIRNAFAHRDYQVAGDEIQLSPSHRHKHNQPSLQLPIGDVHDAVLSAVEVGHAMELALTVALEDHDAAGVVTAPTQFLASVMLAAVGCTGVEIAVDGRRAMVTASVDRRLPTSALGFLVPPFVGATDELLLRLQREGTTADLLVPVTQYATWVDMGDGPERDIAYLDFMRGIHRDGHPIVSSDHLRKLVSFNAARAVVDTVRPYSEVNAELKAWRALARRHALDDVVELIGRAQLWRLTRESGGHIGPSEMDDLLAEAAKTVEPLQTTLT